MINHNLFPDDGQHKFLIGGYTEDHLRKNMQFVPSWVPEEYFEFFRDYFGYMMDGIEIFGPGPTSEYDNELEEYVTFFYDSFPDVDNVFPIGYMDEDSWVIYKNVGGTVQCGLFDFENGDWFGGAPYANFEQFTNSLA